MSGAEKEMLVNSKVSVLLHHRNIYHSEFIMALYLEIRNVGQRNKEDSHPDY
jgi:hypothetical protein